MHAAPSHAAAASGRRAVKRHARRDKTENSGGTHMDGVGCRFSDGSRFCWSPFFYPLTAAASADIIVYLSLAGSGGRRYRQKSAAAAMDDVSAWVVRG